MLSDSISIVKYLIVKIVSIIFLTGRPSIYCLFGHIIIALTSWRNSQYAMSETAYNISLKGYVGGLDCDRSKVNKELAKNEGKEVIAKRLAQSRTLLRRVG